MMTQQQIIGVSDRLGANLDSMQGTTRAIYDMVPGVAANGTMRFFENVQTRPYPFSNISQNRFETGESLAIESIAVLLRTANNFGSDIVPWIAAGVTEQLILNLYIGNQRVIKDLDLTYSRNQIGTTNTIGTQGANFNQKAVLYLETPIVIPPLIEFYADVQSSLAIGNTGFNSVSLILQGTGTLLNTQKNF
jgi:hypothetical protein